MIDRFRSFAARLRGLFGDRRADRELDDEIETHLRLLTEKYIRQGASEDEAARTARRQFGNITLLKEVNREMRGIRFIETLFQDLRYSVRMLLKHKGFTTVAVLTLALGIGANTAIFSVVNAVLLNPFAYPDADQIMYLSQYDSKRSADTAAVTYPNFLDWQKQQTTFTHLAAARAQTFSMTSGDEPIFVNGAMISPDAFPLLKLPPYLGRVFTEQDNHPGAPRTAVLSYAFWQSRFGGATDVIGRTMLLDYQAYTVIGVMPPPFKFWGTEIWVPYGLFGNEDYATNRRFFSNTGAVGRLKPGVTIKQARAELSVIAARLAKQYSDSNKDFGVKIVPLNEAGEQSIRPALMALMGAVGLVLLIACANVANLLIARDAGRAQELAIRAALGAGRARLLRQLLLESLPLSLLGSLAGLLLARSGLGLLMKLLPEDLIPAETDLRIHARALGFTLLLTLLTTLICSLLPALRFSRGAALEGLRNAGRPGAGVPGSQRMRGALVILEVALSVVLLVGAGLLIKSFARLQHVDLGFNMESLLTIDLSLSSRKYSQPQQLELFYREALERVNATPGVESAAFMNNAPFGNFGVAALPLIRDGQVFNSLDELSGRVCRYLITHGDAISALGTPLILGRGFTEQDTSNSPPVAIINQAAVDKFFPGESPLGKRIKLGLPDNLIQPGMLPKGLEKFSWVTVVGVVKNHRQFLLGNELLAAAFIPLTQAPQSTVILKSSTLLVRSTRDTASLVNAVRRQIHSVDPDLPFAKVATMEARVNDALKPQRFNTLLMGLFAALALLLAVVGLYGVLSYLVAQRSHEIGVRMALGAQTRDVLGLVAKEGMILTLIGMAIGLLASLGLTRLIKGLLFSVSPNDPAPFLVIALLFPVVALLACYLPARRATKVDPMVALRSE